MHREDVLQYEADHERGNADQEEADNEGAGVEEFALAESRDEADQDAEEGFDGQGEQSQAGGDREGLRHHVAHRATGVSGAQVTLEEVADVDEVLHDERLVQVVLGANLLDHSGGRGSVAVQGRDGVSGEREHHEVDQQRCTEKHRDHLKQAFAGVPDHQVPKPERLYMRFTITG